MLTTTLPVESTETSAFISGLMRDLDAVTTGDHYLIGNSAMGYEMENSFHSELLLITILTAVSIFLVVVFTFRSLIIPALLVLLVQCGVYITVMVVGLQGLEIYYLALLIVECILMGATTASSIRAITARCARICPCAMRSSRPTAAASTQC